MFKEKLNNGQSAVWYQNEHGSYNAEIYNSDGSLDAATTCCPTLNDVFLWINEHDTDD